MAFKCQIKKKSYVMAYMDIKKYCDFLYIYNSTA